MNELKGFYSDQFGAIRAVNIDGEPWFNATDITTALGYRNSRDATERDFRGRGERKQNVNLDWRSCKAD